MANKIDQGAARGAAQYPKLASGQQSPTTIRELNDQFRQTLRGGKVFITAGVEALGPEAVLAILIKIREFDEFGEDNDPRHEHDFGSIEHGGERIFWKIDYYDQTLTAGSPDPADPFKTARVLTVMLAEEY